MDYYEELGVDRLASPEEIRHAYKQLVRLLHPDHCSDDAVRPLADLQMKRLNGMLHILTNPGEREIYDRGLLGSPSPPGFASVLSLPPVLRRVPRWFWPVAAMASGLVLVVLLTYTPPSVPHPVPGPEPAKPPSPAVSKKRPQLSPVAGALARSPSSRNLPADQTQEPPFPPDPDGWPPIVLPPDLPVNDAPVLSEVSTIPASPVQSMGTGPPPVPVSEGAPAPPSSQMSGVWLLLPSPHPQTGRLYPPEYIELRLSEVSGTLRGRYLARYHIPDQAISPVVSFQFEGPAGPDRANLPWSGAGGARGEVRLHLLTRETLEVTWVASQLSRELGLISGTATLVRKLD